MSKKYNVNHNWYYIRRFWWMLGLLFIGFSILLLRLIQLQFIDVEILVYEGDRRSLRAEVTLGKRGMILDRAGKPLAISISAFSIWVDPVFIHTQPLDWKDPRWQQLATILGIPLKQIQEKITHDATARFKYLSRQVTQAEAEQISSLNIPGVYQHRGWRRFYPMGEQTAPLIGITDIDGKGVEGLEKSFDDLLRGSLERNVLRRGRFGNLLIDAKISKPEPAQNIQLTIDERLQSIAYRELSNAVVANRADSGALILTDIQTGEILALVNYPSFNPNNRSTLTLKRMRNHVISDLFEPGSVVKPFVLIVALQKKVVQPDTIVEATPFKLNGYEVKDVSYTQRLSLTEIIQKSSNTAISRIALRLTPQDLLEVYQQFGLGKKSNLQLVGEQTGYFPRDKKRWADIDKATFSFGYGQMVTPLQIAQAYTTLGNFGQYRPLSILLNNISPVSYQVEYSKKNIQDVLWMMQRVATGNANDGTVPGYRVATKTGTSKKVGEAGKYVDEYTSYIAGVAPAEAPRYALVVMVDNPKAGEFYGRAVAAPVFTRVMTAVLRVMNIKPDDKLITK